MTTETRYLVCLGLNGGYDVYRVSPAIHHDGEPVKGYGNEVWTLMGGRPDRLEAEALKRQLEEGAK
jgi:hypothetical protein